MTSTPTVSWLIAVKDGMPYLPETLASIEAQTCKDFEVLAWDNGSTDGSVEELQRWIPQRLPGKVVVGQPKNLGASRRALVELSQAEFCAQLDADDMALPHRLQTQLDYLRQHPEIAVLGANLRYVDSLGYDSGRQTNYPLIHEDIVATMLINCPIGQPSVVFRREAVLATGNYTDRIELSGVEDYELWLRMAPKFRLANLPEVLTYYRIHERSTTQKDHRANLLQGKTDRAFIPNARALYGWDENLAAKFRTRQLPFMLPVAIDLARTRAAAEGTTMWKQLRRPALVGALFHQTNKYDFCSMIVLYMLNAERLPMAYYLSKAVRKLASRSSFGRAVMGTLSAWRARRGLRAWIGAQRRKESDISTSLFFKGVKAPYSWVTAGSRLSVEREVTIWIAPDDLANPRVEIGDDTFIGFQTFLGAYQPLRIGARVLIGAFCYIIAANHRYARRDIAIKDQGFEGAPITIEDDVWLGTHVVVLPGVTIGRGAIVSAGSVVNRDIPAWEIWGGVPARFIKQRPE